MPRTFNPFSRRRVSGYNDPAMAAAAQSIGALFTMGESPYQREDREAKSRLMGAQTQFNEAGARKRSLEADAIAAEERRRTDDEIGRTVLGEIGIDPNLPNADVQAMLDADERLKRKFLGGVAAYRGALTLPGKTNSQQFEAGRTEAADRSLGEMVLGGGVDAGRAGAAVAAREGRPLVDIKGDTRFSRYLLDAPMTTTAVGEAEIGLKQERGRTEQATQGTRRAQANQANAAAGLSGARTRQVDAETKSGVSVGAPVVLDDGTYASPTAAVGRKAGARPLAARTGAATKLPFNSGKVLDEEIAAQFGDLAGELKPEEKTAIRERASRLYPEVGNATEAVRRARAELGFDIAETPGRIYGTNRTLQRPKKTLGQMVAPGGAQRGEQRKSLNGKSYVKINGQWYEE